MRIAVGDNLHQFRLDHERGFPAYSLLDACMRMILFAYFHSPQTSSSGCQSDSRPSRKMRSPPSSTDHVAVVFRQAEPALPTVLRHRLRDRNSSSRRPVRLPLDDLRGSRRRPWLPASRSLRVSPPTASTSLLASACRPVKIEPSASASHLGAGHRAAFVDDADEPVVAVEDQLAHHGALLVGGRVERRRLGLQRRRFHLLQLDAELVHQAASRRETGSARRSNRRSTICGRRYGRWRWRSCSRPMRQACRPARSPAFRRPAGALHRRSTRHRRSCRPANRSTG